MTRAVHAMRARAGTAAIAALLLAATFGLSLAAGYVYAHEPQPERVEIRVDSSHPPDTEQILPGTITDISSVGVEITTVLGAELAPFDALVTEDLAPIAEVPTDLGAQANVGGTRAESGYVLSGVVIVGPVEGGAP